MIAVVAAFAVIGTVLAQDPAQGWLGYAKGVSPTGEGRITYVEAKWKVGAAPKPSNAFFSPWFGIESSDNLNLLQPVNPWTGNQWLIYNEYFQWSPENNKNSQQLVVSPGDILFGSVTFNPAQQSYTLYHSDLNTGKSVSMTIPVQKKAGDYKNYTIIYVVFEKEARCSEYPPDGEVTFFDFKVEYDGVVTIPTWTTGIVDDVCNNRAHVLNGTTIQITWNTADPVEQEMVLDITKIAH